MALQEIQNLAIHPVGKPGTLKEINELNHQFWSKESGLMEQRMADPEILKIAINDIESESIRLPIYYQKSFTHALEIAAKNKEYFLEAAASNFQVDFSKKGGAAPKADALQKIILEIVQRKPSITEPELLLELENRKFLGTISDIDHGDGFIEFQNGDQRFKRARISGLKDRLSRAKKKFSKK